jgi:hypothetical protein
MKCFWRFFSYCRSVVSFNDSLGLQKEVTHLLDDLIHGWIGLLEILG